MLRYLAYFYRLLAILLVLGAVSVGVLAYGASKFVDTPRFRQLFLQKLSRATGSEVGLDGELDVRLFPKLGVEATQLRLTPRDEVEPLLSIRSLVVEVDVLPLLDHRLVADVLVLDGVTARLLRRADGSANWDGLVAAFDNYDDTDAAGGGHAASEDDGYTLTDMDIGGLQLSDVSISYLDETTERSIQMRNGSLHTGSYRPGEPLPFDLRVELISDDLSGSLALSGHADPETFLRTPAMQDVSLSLDASGAGLSRKIGPLHAVGTFGFDAEKGTAALSNAVIRAAGVQVRGSLRGKSLRSAPTFEAVLETEPFDPVTLLSRLEGHAAAKSQATALSTSENKGAKARLSGRLTGDADGVQVRNLMLELSQMQFKGEGEARFGAHPSAHADLQTDALHVDALRTLLNELHSSDATPKSMPASSDSENGEAAIPTWFQTWNLAADLAVGKLYLPDKTTSEQVAVHAESHDGTFAATVKVGKIRGGKAQGDVSGDFSVNGEAITIDAKANAEATGIELARLWPDAEYSGPLDLSLTSTLAKRTSIGLPSVDDLIDGLSGTVDVVGASIVERTETAKRATETHASASPEREEGEQPARQLRASLRFQPSGRGRGATHDLRLKGSLKLDRDSALSATVTGSVRWNDAPRRMSAGPMGIDISWTGPELPSAAATARLRGQVRLLNEGERLILENGTLNAIGLSVALSATVNDPFSAKRTATGRVAIPTSSIRNLLRLYEITPRETRDPKALGDFHVATAFSYTPEALAFREIDGNIDGTKLTGEVSVWNFSRPSTSLNLHLVELDTDRYRRPRRSESEANKPSPPREPQKLPLETLRKLRLGGSVIIDRLRVYRAWAQSVRVTFSVRDGIFAVDPMRAAFYGGQLSASLHGQVSEDALQSKLVADIGDFAAGPFLHDVGGRNYIEGASDVSGTLEVSGATGMGLLRSMHGEAKAKIRDGSYRFSAPRPVRTGPNGEEEGPPQRTVFRRVSAHFNVREGVFHNDKFSFSSPLLGLGVEKGAQFSLPDNTIEVTLLPSFVRLATIPIRIHGPLDDPYVSVSGGEAIGKNVENLLGIPVKGLKLLRDLVF